MTKGKRKMLHAGASINANAVMNEKLAPSTLETITKVDANICSYMMKRYVNTYILRGRTLLKKSGQILEQKLHIDAKSLCNFIIFYLTLFSPPNAMVMTTHLLAHFLIQLSPPRFLQSFLSEIRRKKYHSVFAWEVTEERSTERMF